MTVSNLTAVLAVWAAWLLGALYGGYRYERLTRDRPVREVVRDLRGRGSQ